MCPAMLAYRGVIYLTLATLVLGPLLIIGCIGGLLSGEGKYDRDSSNWMVASQVFGIVLGIALLATGIVMFNRGLLPLF